MERNYYYDNYKAVLIVFVVTTHFLGGMAGETGWIKTYTIFTNLFYMPAFIMISGIFSKDNNLIKLIKNILLPYFFFQIINLLIDWLVLKQNISFSLLMPEFTLWYLLSLFFWRFLIDNFMKLKYPLLFSVILSLIVGLDSNVGGLLSLSRTFYYFPFFILGYQLKEKNISKIQKKSIQAIAIGIIIITIAIIFFTCEGYSEFYFRGSTSYEGLGQTIGQGIVFRVFCYIIAIILTFCIAMLIPKKKKSFSLLGSRTMSVYMWHGLIYRILRYGTPIYTLLATSGRQGHLVLVLFTLFIILILASAPFSYLTGMVSKIPINILLKTSRRNA